MIFVCDIKIDNMICEPHCVSGYSFFVWTASLIQLFDFLTFVIPIPRQPSRPGLEK